MAQQPQQSQQPQQQQQQQRPDPNRIAKSFVEFFYNKFDNDRKGLNDLYKNNSMLSYEGDGYQGQQKIMDKLTNGVKYKKIQHFPKTLDVQPSAGTGLLVMVTGTLKVDDENNQVMYTELFHLVPSDQTCQSWWIHNDVFRLCYA